MSAIEDARVVWTDERIREAFIYDGGEAEYHDPINGAREQRRVAGATFDAWLIAHDAEVRRQGPITDEWEYGYELIEQDTRDVLARGWPFNTWEEAMRHAVGRAEEESDPDTLPLVPQVVRRRKAGPWEPVEATREAD